MAELILDGECHNGQRAERLANDHWRLETRADTDHYGYYFHFRLRAAKLEEVVVDVGPDSDRPGGIASFRRHCPEGVWIWRGTGWERHPVDPGAPGDCVRIRLALKPAIPVSVSRTRPIPLSRALDRLSTLAALPAARSLSLGRSCEGRPIPALEIGGGTRHVLVLAGQHPAEFGGTHAVLGIAEWLLSRVPEAVALRERFTFTVLPTVNPDGNVRGQVGCNARGEDLYRAYPGAAAGREPEAPEAACLWRRIDGTEPELTLNLHSFVQPSATGCFPWEGLYTAPDDAFSTPSARERQRRLDDLLSWETDGLSQHGGFTLHVEGALEHQLARRGILTVFYEVQDLFGPFRHRRTGVQVLRTALKALGDGP